MWTQTTLRLFQRVRRAYRIRVLRVRGMVAGNLHKHGWRKYEQLSDEETIQFLLENKGVGIVRFGNSELSYIAGHDIRHQVQDERLRGKLINILKTHPYRTSYKVGLPLDATILSENSERVIRRSLWESIPKLVVQVYAKSDYTYLSPFVFRVKNVLTDDKDVYISQLGALFDGRDVIYVGPTSARNREIWDRISVKAFIPIPETNAFSRFDEIKLDVIRRSEEYNNPIVLIVAGITATVLSSELNECGIVSYDLGQITRHVKEATQRNTSDILFS